MLSMWLRGFELCVRKQAMGAQMSGHSSCPQGEECLGPVSPPSWLTALIAGLQRGQWLLLAGVSGRYMCADVQSNSVSLEGEDEASAGPVCQKWQGSGWASATWASGPLAQGLHAPSHLALGM